jgi:hypothetical protein
MLEREFRKKVDKAIKKLPNSQWFSIQQVAIRGVPDKLGCVNGVFVALELKASAKSKRAKLQEHFIQKLKEAGAVAHFAYPENWAEILEELKAL